MMAVRLVGAVIVALIMIAVPLYLVGLACSAWSRWWGGQQWLFCVATNAGALCYGNTLALAIVATIGAVLIGACVVGIWVCR